MSFNVVIPARLNSSRLKEKVLIKMKIFPFKVPEKSKSPFPNIKKSVPLAPKITPSNLRMVKCSTFRIKEINSTSKGLVTIKTDALIGEVYLSPVIKKLWLMTTPKKAQAARMKRSFLSTFSLTKNTWMNTQSSATRQKSFLRKKRYHKPSYLRCYKIYTHLCTLLICNLQTLFFLLAILFIASTSSNGTLINPDINGSNPAW
mgnify:CR=1 FL=1